MINDTDEYIMKRTKTKQKDLNIQGGKNPIFDKSPLSNSNMHHKFPKADQILMSLTNTTCAFNLL